MRSAAGTGRLQLRPRQQWLAQPRLLPPLAALLTLSQLGRGAAAKLAAMVARWVGGHWGWLLLSLLATL